MQSSHWGKFANWIYTRPGSMSKVTTCLFVSCGLVWYFFYEFPFLNFVTRCSLLHISLYCMSHVFSWIPYHNICYICLEICIRVNLFRKILVYFIYQVWSRFRRHIFSLVHHTLLARRSSTIWCRTFTCYISDRTVHLKILILISVILVYDIYPITIVIKSCPLQL